VDASFPGQYYTGIRRDTVLTLNSFARDPELKERDELNVSAPAVYYVSRLDPLLYPDADVLPVISFRYRYMLRLH